MLAYVLDKDVSGEKLLQDVQNLIIKFKQENPQSIPILVIDIKTISKEDNSLTPKLEHKILESDCIT
jgi:hypothetical protein